jgi:NitT/TauT family transport system substrate-binding protein
MMCAVREERLGLRVHRFRSGSEVRRYAIIFAGVGALLLIACQPAQRPPLRVGLIAFPGHEPMFLARTLGYFDSHAVQLVELPSSVEVLRAYRAGVIDVAALSADEALNASQPEPAAHGIILVLDISHGSDVIVARPELTQVSDLRGRRVGVEPNTLGAVVLARALQTAGLTPADVTPVPIDLADHERAYVDGQVDAVVTFAPRSSRLLANGARKIFDTTQIPGEILDVLLTRTDVVDERGDALRALLSGWFEALQYLQERPLDAAAVVAARERVTPQQFLESLQDLILPDLATNRRMLGDSPENMAAQLSRLAQTMVGAKLLDDMVDPAPLLEDGLLPES